VSGRLLLLFSLVASALALGYGSAGARATTNCPVHEPQPLIPMRKGPRLLVRPGATSVLLCRYRGLNPRATALRLRSSRLITRHSELASVVTGLNGLSVAKGVLNCPMDDGSAILVRFSYPHRAATTVRIGLTGCRTVTGAYLPLRTAASPDGARLVAELERLVP